MDKLKDYAEIYLITSPSGKQYIGKANCITSKRTKHGTMGRWLGHISDSKQSDGGRCRLLNIEIRSYDYDKFNIERIVTCKIEDTAYFEKYFIKSYNTLYKKDTNPNGLNLQEGGNSGPLSEETKKIMSINRKLKPSFTKPHTAESKQLISNTLIDNVVRYGHNNNELPKYVKYVNWEDRKGYQIVSHPKCKLKNFVSSKLSLQDLYETCMSFLNNLE